jgi:hypothetical protein
MESTGPQILHQTYTCGPSTSQRPGWPESALNNPVITAHKIFLAPLKDQHTRTTDAVLRGSNTCLMLR